MDRLKSHCAQCPHPALCGCRLFQRQYLSWRKECNLPGRSDLSWLWFRISGQKFQTICLVCHCQSFSIKGGFKAGAITQLRKHGRSRKHQQLLASYLGKEFEFNVGEAPSVELYRDLFVEFKRGTKPTGGYKLPTGLLGKKKANQMLWSIYEADLDLRRKHIQKSDVMTVSRDERHSRCAIHYRSIDDDLVMESVFMGQTRGVGGDALSIFRSTDTIIRNFCTRFAHPPHGAVVRPSFHKTTYEHVCHINEATRTDSAANEVVATADSSTPLSPSGIPLFKKRQFILRDGAHSARRLLTRLYSADPVLDGVIGMFVHWKHSPGQLVQHSKDLADMFATCCENAIHEAAVNTTFKNMRSAMHRFETHTTPLSRCCLNPSGLLAFMVKVSVVRKGEVVGKAADVFLCTVCQSQQCWVLLGMLSDGGLEVLAFIRILDTDDVSTAALCEHISSFLERLEWMFGQGGIMTLTFSHTAYIMDWLETPHFFTLGNRCMCVGGSRPDSSVISTCLGHMQAWLRLAKITLEAEFPSFTIINAFSAFGLPHRRPESATPFTDIMKRKFARLAATFKQPELQGQVEDHYPAALAEYLNSDCKITYWDAWAKSMQRTELQRRRTGVHPCHALKYVVKRGNTYAPVTACVEHGFSKASGLLNLQSLSCSPATENRNVYLILLEPSPGRLDSIIEQARIVYSEAFPIVSKLHVKSRTNKGVMRKARAPRPVNVGRDVSEVDFKRRLRSEVAAKVGSQVSSPAVTNIWTTSHAEEERFQTEKILNRFVEANISGQLLPEEVNDDLNALTLLEQVRQLKSLRARQAAGQNQLAQLQNAPPTKDELHRARIMLDTGMSSSLESRDLSCHEALEVCDPWKATVFVAKTPWKVNNSMISWAAALLGVWIVTPASLRLELAPALKFTSALKTRRHIWMSAAFRREHILLTQLILECAHASSFKAWKFIDSAETFAALRVRKNHRK